MVKYLALFSPAFIHFLYHFLTIFCAGPWAAAFLTIASTPRFMPAPTGVFPPCSCAPCPTDIDVDAGDDEDVPTLLPLAAFGIILPIGNPSLIAWASSCFSAARMLGDGFLSLLALANISAISCACFPGSLEAPPAGRAPVFPPEVDVVTAVVVLETGATWGLA